MWYGIYEGFNQLDDNSHDKYIVSFRYDYFGIIQKNGVNEKKIIQFIKDNLNVKDIRFIKYETAGTDNLYIGKYNKMKTLIKKFHFELDDVLKLDKEIVHQEILVNLVAKII